MKQLVAIALLLGCGSAQAAPVEWTFNNVTFGGGSALTGSFTYDAATGIYDLSNTTLYCGRLCEIETTTFTSWPLVRGYSDALDIASDDFYPPYDYPIAGVWFYWGESLASTIATVLQIRQGEIGMDDGYWLENSQMVSGATISRSVIPIPAAVWLFASGLGLLGWMRRRQLS
jgi:hypothetical protein